MNWKGVIPAITTNLDAAGAVDHAALASHCQWLVRSGCTGIVCCGSLGEAATLSFEEKLAVAATCVRAVGKQVPVVLGIASLATVEAVKLARGAEEAGCARSEEHTSELQSQSNLVCRLLLEKKNAVRWMA